MNRLGAAWLRIPHETRPHRPGATIRLSVPCGVLDLTSPLSFTETFP
jgi:hypothetical protein